jgi:hypothetical protein
MRQRYQSSGFQGLRRSVILSTAPWWWWEARSSILHGDPHHDYIGIVLALVGLAYLCWLLFALAVYALPLFAGITAGLAIYHTGSGPIGAIIVGLIAGTITLIAGQIALMTLRSPFVRAGIALLFAVPAATAGYHAALGVAHIGIPAEGWRQAMALLGAIVVGGHSLDAHDAFCAAPGCPTWHYRCRDSLDPLTWLPGRAELPPCVISRAAGADFEPTHDHSSAARRSASIALRRGHCPARRDAIGARCDQLSGLQCRPSARKGFFSFARCGWPLVRVTRLPPPHPPQCYRGGASHVASDGLIWPKDGCASIA